MKGQEGAKHGSLISGMSNWTNGVEEWRRSVFEIGVVFRSSNWGTFNLRYEREKIKLHFLIAFFRPVKCLELS